LGRDGVRCVLYGIFCFSSFGLSSAYRGVGDMTGLRTVLIYQGVAYHGWVGGKTEMSLLLVYGDKALPVSDVIP
jgi:hypothetical protein